MPTPGDVRERLESYYGTPVPISLARLLAVLLTEPEQADRFLDATGFSVTDAIDPALVNCAAPLPSRPTFRYGTQPPELLVFATTGTDGEQIGLLQLAEELPFDELPAVGFFPMQFGAETFALGDDLERGICAVMSTYDRDPADIPPLSLPEVFPRPLHPAPRPSYAPYIPRERKGYRFEMTIDHVRHLCARRCVRSRARPRNRAAQTRVRPGARTRPDSRGTLPLDRCSGFGNGDRARGASSRVADYDLCV